MNTSSAAFERLSIVVDEATTVSASWLRPPGATVCLVLAHGAGAGMDHPFMVSLALDLAALDMATLRYQFPFAERGGRRPDPPPICHATVRAAVRTAHRLAPRLCLLGAGKSFGGRMTSQAQAIEPMAPLAGLVFFGFPLHPPQKPAAVRGEHLAKVALPMLFLQGTRDALAEPALMQPMVAELGPRATLASLEHADHSFHVTRASGSTDAQVRTDMLAALASWSQGLIGNNHDEGRSR